MVGSVDVAPEDRTAADIKALHSMITESLFGAKMPEVEVGLDISDMELRQKCGGILHPKASVRITYNMVQAVILMYFVYTLPKRLAFDVKDLMLWEIVLDVLIDFSILVDIGVNFCSFYYNRHGILIIDDRQIRNRYLRTWFPIDFVSVVPADQIVKAIGYILMSDSVKRAATITRLVKLIRFLRMAKLPKQLDLEQMQLTLSYLMRPLGVSLAMVQFFFTILFLTGLLFGITHIFGCLWASTGYEEFSLGTGWMMHYYGADQATAVHRCKFRSS